MNKRDAQSLVRGGGVTLGMLRSALASMKAPPWERSTVNSQLTKEQALKIFREAIATDNRPDNHKMGDLVRDEMMAVNIVRECGLSAIFEARKGAP